MCDGTNKVCFVDVCVVFGIMCNDNIKTIYMDVCFVSNGVFIGICGGIVYNCDDLLNLYLGCLECVVSGMGNGEVLLNFIISIIFWDAGCDWNYMDFGIVCGD